MIKFNDYENKLVHVEINGDEMTMRTTDYEEGVYLCQKPAGKDWNNVGTVSCEDATNAVQKMLAAGGKIIKES
jgi:predicted enzyme related to lactoylglutathione lyase